MKLNNEKGGALLLVLLTITLLSIFSLGLLYQLHASSSQFSKTEKQIQARNVAEMGLQHVRELVRTYRDDFPLNVEETKKDLQDTILKYAWINEIDNSQMKTQYSLFFNYFSIEDNSFQVGVESVGEVGNESYTVDETLKFTLFGDEGWRSLEGLDTDTQLPGYIQNSEDQFKTKYKTSTCNARDEYICESNQQFVADKVQLKNGVKLTINGNLALNRGIDLKKDSLLTINGDFYSGKDDNKKNIVGNKATIIVNGNAYLPKNNLNMKHPKICISGSTNYPDPIPIDSCSYMDTLGDKEYGVYVSGELADGLSWKVETKK